ncbi:MAG: L-threonylcarbamoyladenylate synthase [Pseudomonadota bacterium]
MAQFFVVHPDSPQPRLIQQTVDIIQRGGVVAYPTDSSYALGCSIGNKQAMDRIRTIRRVDHNHNFTLVCRDLSELSLYARVDNEDYRLLKRLTPGPYTFILPASREVPRRLQHPRRKTIGLRVPAFPIVSAILDRLDEPLMSSTLILPKENLPMNDADEIRLALEKSVDAVIDGGPCVFEPTTVIGMTGSVPEILRSGGGDPLDFIHAD